jgi:thiol-disulfide isomerase/thioredoxin
MAEQRRPNVLVLAAIAIAVLAVVAIVFTKSGGDDDDAASTTATTALSAGHVEVDGTALAPFDGEAPSDPSVGAAAPVLTGQAFDGSALTVGDKAPAVIVFVAHWCPHCQREVPFLVRYFGDNGVPKGLNVYAVATANDAAKPNFPPSAWLARERWSFPTMVDDKAETAGVAYGLTAFPYFVAVDAQGKVAARASGELDADALAALLRKATG